MPLFSVFLALLLHAFPKQDFGAVLRLPGTSQKVKNHKKSNPNLIKFQCFVPPNNCFTTVRFF